MLLYQTVNWMPPHTKFGVIEREQDHALPESFIMDIVLHLH